MAFVVLYDACVLFPAPLRDILLRVAVTGLVRARWTERILEECFRNISEQRPDLKPAALTRTRKLMNEAVPDCLVKGFDDLIEGLRLPDPNDRHVLAAAIRAGAQAIVTFNLRDFPRDQLAPFGVEAVHPDDFVVDLIDLAPGVVANVVAEQAARCETHPEPSPRCWTRFATRAFRKPLRSSEHSSGRSRSDESRSSQTGNLMSATGTFSQQS